MFDAFQHSTLSGGRPIQKSVGLAHTKDRFRNHFQTLHLLLQRGVLSPPILAILHQYKPRSRQSWRELQEYTHVKSRVSPADASLSAMHVDPNTKARQSDEGGGSGMYVPCTASQTCRIVFRQSVTTVNSLSARWISLFARKYLPSSTWVHMCCMCATVRISPCGG